MEYLLVFYLVASDYSYMKLRLAVGPMTKDNCIDLSISTPELIRIYEIKDTIFLCTKVNDFKKNHPGMLINKEYK